ncbi:MAG TPA: amidohydrolase family protein [Alphaproteobacteria bacterium]|nr:amidohydrolase family protein [Alphaproteobacteria bacterium]
MADQEKILQPELPIIDPHHHLMNHYNMRYEIENLKADMADGHNIQTTVYVECRRGYREDLPANLAPVGETETVEAIVAPLPKRPTDFCAGIVAHADLLLGDAVDEVLDAHQAASKRFRGIRHLAAWDDDEAVHLRMINEHPHLLAEPAFHEGARRLAARGLSLDTWLYHPQLPELAAFARAVPDVQIVLDHMGMPVGVGRYAGKRAEVDALWRQGIREVAACPNVVVKLGGFVMPISGFGWHERAVPVGSEELARTTRAFYLFLIDAFGPDRCMFESNFPMDREAAAYNVLWNSFKRIAAGFSDAEKDALFRRTAARIYRLDT